MGDEGASESPLVVLLLGSVFDAGLLERVVECLVEETEDPGVLVVDTGLDQEVGRRGTRERAQMILRRAGAVQRRDGDAPEGER
ncbi:hypothetical protein ACL07V_22260 [Streptomyces sp. MB22_4]|uniref:hypothetical protein n=1 Tax=Streptomyces sp. MB22_4 TaxID=3383120 RepID=UPI0039A10D33